MKTDMNHHEADAMDDETHLTTWAGFLERARELRALEEAAKEHLLSFLYEGEQRRELWAATGKTFVELIDSAGICKATRYIAWKRIRDGHGKEAVAGIGTHGVVAAASLPTKESQREVLDRVRQHEKVNGTTISEQSANRLARETKLLHIGQQHGRPRGYLELQRENAHLREKLRTAEQTILALRAELRSRVAAKDKARPSRKASA